MELSELKSKEWYVWATNSVNGDPIKRFDEYYSIYSLINKENGKRYIGRTQDPQSRIRMHLYGIKHGKHPNELLNQDAGCDFDVEILKDRIMSRKEAARFERFFMLKYKTYDNHYGYNCKDNMMQKVV